ncbi:MAG: GNAT family N-acetyltransferase [Acidobacteriota bacterium]|nr:GNAT family N-acetyltransferase [Acidobacteriota bacterium]
MRSAIAAKRVVSSVDRESALQVVEAVYRHEKRWLDDTAAEMPLDLTAPDGRSWFLVTVGGKAAGVIRLVYDPSLEVPAEYGVTLEPDVDIEGLKQRGRFVDVGRLMIIPRYRRNVRVVLELMRAASVEVVERGYTHFLTTVFADDPHSPLGFHTRVLGFERIGTHSRGELACASVRILLILDIGRAYQRLKERRNRVLQDLGLGIRDVMERRLLAPTI